MFIQTCQKHDSQESEDGKGNVIWEVKGLSKKAESQFCFYLRIAIFKQRRTNRAFKKRESGATKVGAWITHSLFGKKLGHYQIHKFIGNFT